jgi:hypothetical protein
MKGCNYIRECIDEADKPNLLSFEITEHIAHCNDCERFANERTALRTLVASSARVSAPANFNATLNARLADVKARRSLWWLSSPGYLRLGAAAAGLVVMIFAAQYGGLFSKPDQSVGTATPQYEASQPPPTDDLVLRTAPLPPVSELPSVVAVTPVKVTAPRREVPVRRGIPDGYLAAEDGGVVLVRGQNGDMDVQMPTVSVGAQPLLYVGGGQRTMHNVGTSF